VINPNKLALKNIRSGNLVNFSFDLKKGEIHALYGEHLSGKSDLVKILSGVKINFGGQLFLDGKQTLFSNPRDSQRRDISVIYQYSNLISEFNAYENVFAGRFITGGLRILNKREMVRRLKNLMERFDVDFNLAVPVRKLTPFERNFVEIVKAVLHNPEVLILDDVSSRFKAEELKILHTLLGELRSRGKSIIYIFSNINEDFDFADRITILKEGRRQGTEDVVNVDKGKLIELSYSRILTAGNDWNSFLEKSSSRLIIDELKEGIIVLNSRREITAINRSAIAILDLSSSGGNLMDRLKEEFVLDDNSRELILSSLEKQFHLSLSSVELINGKYMDIVVYPVLSEEGEKEDTIIILGDVTEKSHMQEYKVGADKIFSVAELAAGVVHEINNPLAIISNYTALLKMKTGDEKSLEKFGKIEAELERIEEITSSLLSFSKVQSGKTPVDFRQIVRETLVLLEYKIRKKDISFSLEMEGDEPFIVQGNSNKLKQVIINLVTNSIEAVLDEGSIAVSVRKRGSRVRFTIEDNGSGIDEAVKARIYDPFFSTKMTKKNTGLGLAISKQIAEDHRGEIGCHEEDDKTVFFLYLPLAEDGHGAG